MNTHTVQNKKSASSLVVGAWFVLAFLASGCTGSMRDQIQAGSNQYSPPSGWTPPSSGGGDNSSGNEGSSGEGSPVIEWWPLIDSKGSTSYTVPGGTDTVLKVRVHGGDGVVSVNGGSSSGYTTHYGCIKYTIEVNGQTKTTGVLRSSSNFGCDYGWTGYGWGCINADANYCCPQAPESQTLDFSGWIAGSGQQEVRIRVKTASYNRLQCNLQPTYSTHSFSTLAEIQTDFTQSL